MGVETRIEEKSVSEQKGITALREILSKTDSVWITDLDDTIKESRRVLWADGKERKLHPETTIALLAINKAGIKLGIATEQTFAEILPFITDLSELTLNSKNPYALFNGLIVGEGGSVLKSAQKDLVVIAPKRVLEDKKKIDNGIKQILIPSKVEGRFYLKGTNPEEGTLVRPPPDENAYQASSSIWEDGPHQSEDPSYVKRYGKNQQVVEGLIAELGIESLRAFEAGNGTLRITGKFINKRHTLSLLAVYGYLDLSKTIYSCDGPNDLGLADKIKSKGGGVVAVSNAIAQLHGLSDYSATKVAGLGFAEAVSLIFPNEYIQAKKELQHLKLA
ncbi:MAG: HAD hydrolase family protein [Candidatus Woesebacteria bacterium]|nr:HAD hydrolase family protein [Candidatus Woesebacteria bacterium]